jgi:hypothetical protein
MSLCHCSVTVGEASGLGGLWRSTRAASNVPSRPAAGGIIAIVAVECYRRVIAMVAAIAVVTMWAFVRRDRPALEQEVAPPPQSPDHGRRDERSLQSIGCPPSW